MKKKFKQYYDSNTDTFWIVFKSGAESRYEEIAPGVNVEFNKNSEVIGIEIQEFSRLYNVKLTSKNIKNEYTFSQNLGKTDLSILTYKTSSIN